MDEMTNLERMNAEEAKKLVEIEPGYGIGGPDSATWARNLAVSAFDKADYGRRSDEKKALEAMGEWEIKRREELNLDGRHGKERPEGTVHANMLFMIEKINFLREVNRLEPALATLRVLSEMAAHAKEGEIFKTCEQIVREIEIERSGSKEKQEE